MNTQYERIDDESGPDLTMRFYVFMLVFWPTAILLGIFAYSVVPQYDLRLPTLLVALLAGWIAVSVFKARERSDRNLS